MYGFAAKHDDHAGKTGQRDRDLRSDTKSFTGSIVRVLFLL